MTKQDVINKVRDCFIDDPFVSAFWLEGSMAFGLDDEYSDIDMWIDIEDDHIDESIQKLKKYMSPLDFCEETAHPHDKIRQMFWHIEGTSPFMILDICIQKHSRYLYYRYEFVDEKLKIVFDKTGVIKYRHHDLLRYNKEWVKKADYIIATYKQLSILVQKGINRNDYLETYSYYMSHIVQPLITLSRIVYQPTKDDFGLKHIKRDLPSNLALKIEELYKISSINDIKKRMDDAFVIFDEVSKAYKGMKISE